MIGFKLFYLIGALSATLELCSARINIYFINNGQRTGLEEKDISKLTREPLGYSSKNRKTIHELTKEKLFTKATADKRINIKPQNPRRLSQNSTKNKRKLLKNNYEIPSKHVDTKSSFPKLIDDMLLTETQSRMIYGAIEGNDKLNDEARVIFPWPRATVTYRIQNFNESETKIIKNAMKNISDKTCLKFQAATNESETAVTIYRNTSLAHQCSSSLGYNSRDLGNYLLLNDPHCLKPGMILHELLHTLGFVHMHCNYNRDDYVKIVWENIKDGFQHNFKKYSTQFFNDFSVPYDYKSLMHYAARAYALNKSMPTIVPLQPNVTIGQRQRLSVKDILKINIMYCGYDYESTTQSSTDEKTTSNAEFIIESSTSKSTYLNPSNTTPIKNTSSATVTTDTNTAALSTSISTTDSIDIENMSSTTISANTIKTITKSKISKDIANRFMKPYKTKCTARKLNHTTTNKTKYDRDHLYTSQGISHTGNKTKKRSLIHRIFDDMLLTKPQTTVLQRMTKELDVLNCVVNVTYKWPNATVVYRITNMSHEEIALIKGAMTAISEKTCVKFLEAKTETEFALEIQRNLKAPCRCCSTLGYWGIDTTYPQTIHLNHGDCFRHGKIIHELFHTLGLIHMHNNYNRNEHVKIMWKNIITESKPNFARFAKVIYEDFSVPYDYDSIMHYPTDAFSKNGLPTIVPLKDNVTIGQRLAASELDILKVNKMYCMNTDKIITKNQTRFMKKPFEVKIHTSDPPTHGLFSKLSKHKLNIIGNENYTKVLPRNEKDAKKINKKSEVIYNVNGTDVHLNLFEGDILLNRHQKLVVDIANNGNIALNGYNNRTFKVWPNGRVSYRIEKYVFSNRVLGHIKNAMRNISKKTCIVFVEMLGQNKLNKNILHITKNGPGCYATYGYTGQPIINLNCKPHNYVSVVTHELMHILGFMHMQNTYNRDEFVIINWKNIRKDRRSQYQKMSKEFVMDFGIAYDYKSITHYGKKSNTINGKDTITAIRPDIEVGPIDRLTKKDILKINLMYKCQKKKQSEVSYTKVKKTKLKNKTIFY